MVTTASILFALIAAIAPSLAYGAAVATVRVNFAQPVSTRSYVGFLHGVTESAPSDELIRPLRIQHWRTATFESLDGTRMSPATMVRLEAIVPQVKIQYLISDTWGYRCCRPVVRWPFENYKLWDTFVGDLAHEKQQASNAIFYWEVWNEPTIPFFWAGSMDQFFETYARAYRVLRRQLGADALIAGPGFHRYDRDLIKRFLDYCLANRIQVNILTWHENNDRVPIPNLVSHVEEARVMFLQSAEYRSLRMREIHIDEYGGPASKHSPAAMLGYLHYFEVARPGAAAKACWKDSKRRNECFNGSLDGLVDVDTMRPRSVWWAYKLYADGTPSRVASTTSDPAVVALGSRASGDAERAQVLMTHFVMTSKPAPRRVDIVLENLGALSFLSQSAEVVVTISRLATTGEQPSNGPELVQRLITPLSNETHVLIPHFAADDVYVLHIGAGSPKPRRRAVHDSGPERNGPN